MGRPTVWVLLGLTLLAVSLHEVQVGAEVGPSESECRPYIEKAIHNLKASEDVEDVYNESTDNEVSADTGTSSEDDNVGSEESHGGEINSNEDTTVDETTNDETHEETNEDDQSINEDGSTEKVEMTDEVDESFEQADQPIVEAHDSNETHEDKSEEGSNESVQKSEEDHSEHQESEEEHTANVSGEETEEAASSEETRTNDDFKEVVDENKTEEHDDNSASEETTEGDQTDSESGELAVTQEEESSDSIESEEKKDESVEDTTETHEDASHEETSDGVSKESHETESESVEETGEVHESLEKVEASRVGRSLPDEHDETESHEVEPTEEGSDSIEEEHATGEEHESNESKTDEGSVEAAAESEESHEEESHEEEAHAEETHEDETHEAEAHEEESHEEEAHEEEAHEEEAHEEESHEVVAQEEAAHEEESHEKVAQEEAAHEEESHEEVAHEEEAHEKESHEEASHEEEVHEEAAPEEEVKSEEQQSEEKEGSAHEESVEKVHEGEPSKEEVHEEEIVKREVHVDERANPGEHSEEQVHTEDVKDSKEHEDPHPEEDLLMEYDVPTNLRDRSHIAELLHLDDESVSKENAVQKSAEVILRDLKRIYENAIKPLETLYKYRDLSNRHFGDPEIFSKPLVLFMGPWSGGKSTILNYLTGNEYTPDSLRTGAEPSPAYFNILMHGDEPEVLDGTQLAADWTFSGLQKFGQGLEDRLRGLKLPSKLLEKVNIVEIPGILEVRKQVSRLFPFNDACQWFIDRADIIFLVYDPSKLDVGPETEAILDQLKGREYQTRILLNKGDQVKPEELMRVQGALIWNISPLMSSAQPPVMYTTSLWSNPYEIGAPVRLLQAQERSFLRDLRNAIEKRIENKISSARRFAVRVRNHAKMVDCYLTTYYNHKSLFGNKKQIADNIIEHPQNYHIYEGLSTLTNISRYDLPDPEVYRDFFRLNSLYEFKKLSETCTYFRGCPINKLDIAIAYDLPELVGKYKKSVETAFHALEDESNKGKS